MSRNAFDILEVTTDAVEQRLRLDGIGGEPVGE